jgi:hypothetical protein
MANQDTKMGLKQKELNPAYQNVAAFGELRATMFTKFDEHHSLTNC